jgi:hypothetical protein
MAVRLVARDVSEVHPADRVARGPDPIAGSPQLRVDLHAAAPVALDTHALEPDAVAGRFSPQRDQQLARNRRHGGP